MKLQLINKFLHRVRIHGGEFDSSARAMNRAELGNQFQADLRKFRGSTIERKQMSTKTTFKRVALVAVAALGLGVLSVAPSSAAPQADTLSLSASTATTTVVTVEVSVVNVTVAWPPMTWYPLVVSYIVVYATDGAAVAETAENEPSVKAATATSAMRLKVVFVDICFLSIVDLENLPSSA